MRIAIVGLGDIARKAYLPIISTIGDVEPVLCSRNSDELNRLSASYRIRQFTTSVAELAALRVVAAFVHTATDSHEAVVSELLRHGIHVYVDKPFAYTAAGAARMVALAESHNCRLMSGFNRRYAPMYAALAHQPNRRLVILQKHRSTLVDIARRVVFDDFIHVVDTLRFLAPGPIETLKVNGAIHNGALHHVLVQLDGEGFSLLGVMNRDSGITEETLEVMSPNNRWRVQALSQTTHAHGGVERVTNAGDWDTVLWRRGFPQIVQHFLDCVRTNAATRPSAQDSLATHLLCERIVTELEAAGATAMERTE
jgi:virulence factor